MVFVTNTMHTFKPDEIVILLGAGASVDASIPHSAQMIGEVEKLITTDNKWIKYKSLYYYIRSSIYFSDGLRGTFDNKVNYNIERLVNTLDELSKRNEHTLFPFVGSWSPTLVEVAGSTFELITELRAEIVHKLRTEWLAMKNYNQANYFQGLVRFRKEYQYPLRVFTLNYDLCVEKVCGADNVEIERGFDEHRLWDWRQFENEADKDIYLYKLHGSADWFDEDDRLTYSDDTSNIANPAIIFGTTYKLQYRDPFLFLAYEFRKWTLDSQIIVTIGYGFGDEHINRIIQQALNANEERILLVVAPAPSSVAPAGAEEFMYKHIMTSLGFHKRAQIKFELMKAKEFLNNRLSIGYLSQYFSSDDPQLFDEVSEP